MGWILTASSIVQLYFQLKIKKQFFFLFNTVITKKQLRIECIFFFKSVTVANLRAIFVKQLMILFFFNYRLLAKITDPWFTKHKEAKLLNISLPWDNKVKKLPALRFFLWQKRDFLSKNTIKLYKASFFKKLKIVLNHGFPGPIQFWEPLVN